MTKEEVIANMCRLAENYKKISHKSLNDWVRDSGWLLYKNDISINDIQKYLSNTPDLIDGWLSYSDDKRTNGWYFYFNEKTNRYFVGYLDIKAEMQSERIKELKYSDPVEACANYILNEFERFTFDRLLNY